MDILPITGIRGNGNNVAADGIVATWNGYSVANITTGARSIITTTSDYLSTVPYHVQRGLYDYALDAIRFFPRRIITPRIDIAIQNQPQPAIADAMPVSQGPDFLDALPDDILIDELLRRLDATEIANLLQTNRSLALRILDSLPINLLRIARLELNTTQSLNFAKLVRLFWTHTQRYTYPEKQLNHMQSTVIRAVLERLNHATPRSNLNLAQTRFELVEQIIRVFSQNDLLMFIQHTGECLNCEVQSHVLAYLSPLCARDNKLQSAYMRAQRQITDFDNRTYAFESLFAFFPSQFLATSNFGILFSQIPHQSNPLHDLTPYLVRQNTENFQLPFLEYIHYTLEHHFAARNEAWAMQLLQTFLQHWVITPETRTILLNITALMSQHRNQIQQLIRSAERAASAPQHTFTQGIPAQNPHTEHLPSIASRIPRITAHYFWPVIFINTDFASIAANFQKANTLHILGVKNKINAEIYIQRLRQKLIQTLNAQTQLIQLLKLIAEELNKQNKLYAAQSYKSANKLAKRIADKLASKQTIRPSTQEEWHRHVLSWTRMLRDDTSRGRALRKIASHLESDTPLNTYLDIALTIKNKDDRTQTLKAIANRIRSKDTTTYWLTHLPLNMIPLFIAWLPENTFRSELIKHYHRRIRTQFPINRSLEAFNDLMGNHNSHKEQMPSIEQYSKI